MDRKNGQSWLGSNWNHNMTTYATTYGWRSTGVRRDLSTKPPELNLVNGDRRGPTGVYETADPITTNQKVAGSSPAERAPNSPANGKFSLAHFSHFSRRSPLLTVARRE
jgi:hypothetical protein